MGRRTKQRRRRNRPAHSATPRPGPRRERRRASSANRRIPTPHRSDARTTIREPSVRARRNPRTVPSRPIFSLSSLRPAFAPLAGLVIGCATVMAVSAMTVTVATSLSPFAMPNRSVLGACFFALGIGVIVPRRLALWLGAGALRKAGIEPTSDEAGWVAPADAVDRSLYWSVLAVIALAGGFAICLAPLGIALAAGFVAVLWDQFVWSLVPLEILHLITAGVVVVLPLGLLGLAASCAHHLSCPHGRWEPRATTWLFLGGAAGVLGADWVSGLGTHPAVSLGGAALPMFLLSIGCMVFASRDGGPVAAVSPDAVDSTTPQFRDRYPRLTRWSVVGVGGGAACAFYVWMQLLVEQEEMRLAFSAAGLAVLGVGSALGSHAGRTFVRHISAYGLACAVAGALVAAAATARYTPAPSGFLLLSGLLALCGLGFALAMGRTLIMHRVGSRSREGIRTAGRLLFCSALTFWVTAPVAIWAFDARATLVMLALSLMAVGGILIMHDTVVDGAARRVRLALVFGAVGIMITLASGDSNPWHDPVASDFPALRREPAASARPPSLGNASVRSIKPGALP